MKTGWLPEGLDGELLLAANKLTANKLQAGSSCASQSEMMVTVALKAS